MVKETINYIVTLAWRGNIYMTFTYCEIVEPLITKCPKISTMIKTKNFITRLNKNLAFIVERTVFLNKNSV